MRRLADALEQIKARETNLFDGDRRRPVWRNTITRGWFETMGIPNAVLVVVGVLAAWLAARRAARLDCVAVVREA